MEYNGYIGIYKPDHHRAMSNGIVYEHILVAESMLGRELEDSEVVHHIDRCRSNNDVSNIMVFKTVYESSKGYDECPICGGQKDRRAKICSSCFHTLFSVKPLKEELEDLLKIHNKSEIGRMYGVSETAVRKWIKSYQL